MKGIAVRGTLLVLMVAVLTAQPAAARKKTTTTTSSTTSTSSSSTTSTTTAAQNQPPIANAGADRAGNVNVAVSFSGAASRDPDGSIGLYWWSWGDGSSSTVGTATTTHTYAAAGTYSVVLWVQDNRGVWSSSGDFAVVTIGTTATTTLPTTTTTSTSRPPSTSSSTTTSHSTTTTTAPNQPPHANAGPDQFTQTLTTLTFNGAASTDADGTIASYVWGFGDNTLGSGVATTHSYASAGTYSVTLGITDNKGAISFDTAIVTVANRPPTANAGPDQSAAQNTSLGFNASASVDPDGSITTYAWSFGDGTTAAGLTPSHVYTAPGAYTAKLTVTDNKGAQSSDTASVTVTSGAWARAIGAADSDGGYAVASDAAGNVYVGGEFHDTLNLGTVSLTSAGASDWFLVKYSAAGTVQWARSMGGAADDYLESIAVDGSGNVIAAGRFSGTATFGGTALVASGSTDLALAKYGGSNGAHQWSKRFGGAYDDDAQAVATDPSGNVYVTGYFRGTIDFGGGVLRVPLDTDLDVFVAKFTGTGAHVWSKNFSNNGNDRGYGIAVDTAGNVAITGSFSNTIDFGGGPLTSANAMTDMFVARFTSAGTHTWSKRFGATDDNEGGNAIAMDGSGNVVVTGYAVKAVDLGGGLLAALGSSDAIVAEYAATSGAHLWSRRLGGASNDYGYGVAVDASGNVFVAGSFDGPAAFGGTILTPTGTSDAFVAKYGPTGAPLWAKALGGASSDVAQDLAVGAGYPVTTGYFYGSGTFDGTALASHGVADAFVVRLAP